MKIEHRDGLLFASLTLFHEGHRIQVSNVIIDTGATQSLISVDTVDTLFQRYEPDDQLIFMSGIGGSEASVRRRIDRIQFDSFSADNFRLDFGSLKEHPGINGLVGLDILMPGRFLIDLERLEIKIR